MYFFGTMMPGTINQISSSDPIPNLNINIQISGHGICQYPVSEDNYHDIVSALADEFLVLFDTQLERAPFSTRIIMSKPTVMYQGATTLRTSILVL